MAADKRAHSAPKAPASAAHASNAEAGPKGDKKERAKGEQSFRTDRAITKDAPAKSRTLSRWNADEGSAHEALGSGKANWDQFAANEKLFGLQTTYDEHIYTTRLDRSAPSYPISEKKAAQIAEEITRTSHEATDGLSEEQLYGAVLDATVPQRARRLSVKVEHEGKPARKASIQLHDAEMLRLQQLRLSETPDIAADLQRDVRDFQDAQRQLLSERKDALSKKMRRDKLEEFRSFSAQLNQQLDAKPRLNANAREFVPSAPQPQLFLARRRQPRTASIRDALHASYFARKHGGAAPWATTSASFRMLADVPARLQ